MINEKGLPSHTPETIPDNTEEEERLTAQASEVLREQVTQKEQENREAFARESLVQMSEVIRDAAIRLQEREREGYSTLLEEGDINRMRASSDLFIHASQTRPIDPEEVRSAGAQLRMALEEFGRVPSYGEVRDDPDNLGLIAHHMRTITDTTETLQRRLLQLGDSHIDAERAVGGIYEIAKDAELLCRKKAMVLDGLSRW